MSQNKTIMVGIAGGTGSGKTTFSNYLEERLLQITSVKLIHMDRYFKKDRPRHVSPIKGKVYDDFNQPDSIDIDRVKEDITQLTKTYQPNVLIIEGFLLFHFTELVEQLDIKIYVDCPAEERLLRRIERFTERGISYEEIISEYLELVRLRHDEYVEPTRWRADLVISGISRHDRPADLILEWIKNELRAIED